MKRTWAGKARTIAVLGSVAVLGGGGAALAAGGSGAKAHHAHAADTSGMPGGPLASLTSGERTALEAVGKAIRAQSTSIATPILDSAVTAGTITSAQEQDLLTLVAKGPIGPGPGGPGGPDGPHDPMGAPPTGATSSS